MALRVAVVGTGFGARIHVPGFRATGRFDVVALIGQDASRTRDVAARLDVPSAYGSLDDALARTALDAVAIATPPATHAALAIAAAQAGKHVLVEPMARSTAEATAMAQAIARAGVVGMVDFEFRFHPARAMLGRLIARGDLGEPRLLLAFDTLPLYIAPYKPPPAWWHDAGAGGGWLGASGSHLLDATRTWLGDVEAVNAMVETLGPGSADDTFAVLARMRSGARAVLHQSAAVLGPRAQTLRLAGSEGTAWLDEAWKLWRSGATASPTPSPPRTVWRCLRSKFRGAAGRSRRESSPASCAWRRRLRTPSSAARGTRTFFPPQRHSRMASPFSGSWTPHTRHRQVPGSKLSRNPSLHVVLRLAEEETQMTTLKKTAVAAILGAAILMTPTMADARWRGGYHGHGHRHYHSPPALIGLGIAGAVLGTIAVVDTIVRAPFLVAAPPPPPRPYHYDYGYRRGYEDGRRRYYDDGYRSRRYYDDD